MISPSVSVCIPTFDRLGYLQEAVGSARAQTRSDVEILIGDDGDSAEIRAWSRSQAGADPRVRYHKTPRRLRLAGNWNFLAGLAGGEFVTLIGDDDRLLPTFVERLVAAVDSDIAVAFSNHHVIDFKGARLAAETRAASGRYGRDALPPGVLGDAQSFVWGNGVPMCAAIVRTAEVRRLKFKEDMNTPELELFVRLAGEGARFVFVEEYLAEYRAHAGSQTSSGLTVDRLAEYLEAVEVPAGVEPAKRGCLGPLLLGGTASRVARGDIAGARALAASRYYPRSPTNPHALAQRLLLALPDGLVRPAYTSLRKLAGSLRRVRAGRAT